MDRLGTCHTHQQCRIGVRVGCWDGRNSGSLASSWAVRRKHCSFSCLCFRCLKRRRGAGQCSAGRSKSPPFPHAFFTCRPFTGVTDLPEAVSSEMLEDDSFLKQFHHALLEVHLEEGALVCPETGELGHIHPLLLFRCW